MDKEPIKNKNFLNQKEAAEYLGVTSNTLYSYVVKSIIRPYKIGGNTRFNYFKISDLDSLFKQV